MVILLLSLFFIWIIYQWLGVIWLTIKTILDIIYWSIVNLYRYKYVDKPLKEKGFIEQKQFEARLIEAEKQNKHKDQILNQQNRIMQAALNATRELRVKYPYADEELFQTFLTRFNLYSMDEIKGMENKVRKNHLENEVKLSINFQPEVQYTLADINGLEAIEERREDPIVMRVYKIGIDYILYVKNIDNNVRYLAQTRDYFVTARMMIKIIEQQSKLKIEKSTMKAEDLNKIYLQVNDSVKNFRRNKMGFLE